MDTAACRLDDDGFCHRDYRDRDYSPRYGSEIEAFEAYTNEKIRVNLQSNFCRNWFSDEVGSLYLWILPAGRSRKPSCDGLGFWAI